MNEFQDSTPDHVYRTGAIQSERVRSMPVGLGRQGRFETRPVIAPPEVDVPEFTIWQEFKWWLPMIGILASAALVLTVLLWLRQ